MELYQAPPSRVQIQKTGHKWLEMNEFTNQSDTSVNTGSKVLSKTGNSNFLLFKGHLCYKIITSQDLISEAQVKNFFAL